MPLVAAGAGFAGARPTDARRFSLTSRYASAKPRRTRQRSSAARSCFAIAWSIAQDIAAAYAEEGRPRGGMGIDWGEYWPGKFAVVITNFANEPNTFLRLDTRKPLYFSENATRVCLGSTAQRRVAVRKTAGAGTGAGPVPGCREG